MFSSAAATPHTGMTLKDYYDMEDFVPVTKSVASWDPPGRLPGPDDIPTSQLKARPK